MAITKKPATGKTVAAKPTKPTTAKTPKVVPSEGVTTAMRNFEV